MSRHLFVSCIASWVLVGCPVGMPEPDASDPCAPGGEPSLALGEGQGGFTELAPGEGWPLVYGPQGGVHLEVGLRATDLDLSDLVAGHLEAEVDGEILASMDPWLDFRCTGDSLESWGTQLVFDVQLDEVSDRLADREVTVRAEVTGRQGGTATTEGVWTVVDPGS